MDILLEALPQYGLAGIILGMFGLLLWKVGMRIVVALDKLIDKIDEHTKLDLEHHAAVREELIALSTRVDTALDITPIRSARPKTNPRGVPVGYYGPRQPTNKDDD